MPSRIALPLLLCVLTAPVCAEQRELLMNPGFEEGLHGWGSWQSPADSVQVETVTRGEGNCVRFLGSPGSRMCFYQTVSVEPLSWYRIRFACNAGPRRSGGGAFGDMPTRLIDAHGKHFDYPCTVTLLDTFGEWREFEADLYAPMSCARVQVEFNSRGACDLRIDDVSVTVIEPPAEEALPNTWDRFAQPRTERLWFSSCSKFAGHHT